MEQTDKIEQGICVAVIVILLAVCASGYGDELHDRAAIAIAINGTSNPWLPPVPKPETPKPKPPKAARLKIYVAYAPFHCPPCETEKRDLAGWQSAEFEIDTPSKFPVAVPFYPYTAWQDPNGKWWHLEQWRGTADLVARWKLTQRGVVKQSLTTGGPHWTHPRSIEAHLRIDHGVNPSGMSHEAMLNWHDRLHEGK